MIDNNEVTINEVSKIIKNQGQPPETKQEDSLGKKKVRKGNSLLEFPDEYVVFDLETTGLSSVSDEIIEIAGLKISNGEIIEKFDELVKPFNPISSNITRITGITNSMVENAKGMPIVGEAFNAFVGDCIVVAHNANFDVNFIFNNFMNYNIGIFDNDFIDTLRLSRRLVKETTNHKLQTLVRYFKFDHIGSHRAMEDTLNTHKLLLELRKIYNQNPSLLGHRYQTLNLEAVETQIPVEDIDTDSPFYGLNVCFTCVMQNFTKQELGQVIANLGGRLQNNVTLKTDVLIIGDVLKQIQTYGSKSRKHQRALKLRDNGQEIELLNEQDVMDLIKD